MSCTLEAFLLFHCPFLFVLSFRLHYIKLSLSIMSVLQSIIFLAPLTIWLDILLRILLPRIHLHIIRLLLSDTNLFHSRLLQYRLHHASFIYTIINIVSNLIQQLIQSTLCHKVNEVKTIFIITINHIYYYD